jgi:hypothetical protein
MAQDKFPNPYSQSGVVGQEGTPTGRALVVNVMDPLKAGRVQIRVHGHHEDMMAFPDERLPWVKIGGSTGLPSMQGSGGSHGLMPGSEVHVQINGKAEQDYLVIASIPNDKKDDNQAIPPQTQGKGDTDRSHSAQHWKDKTFAWKDPLQQVVESTTTQQAIFNRDKRGRKAQKTAEPIGEARDKASVPDHYGKRTSSKDPKGGSIGTFKFPGEQDVQKFIQDTVQNKSSMVPSALEALQNLKKVAGNPTSIQSIGAGPMAGIMSQLSKLFGGGGKNSPARKFDCALLETIPIEELTPEELAQLELCRQIQQQQEADQNSSQEGIV